MTFDLIWTKLGDPIKISIRLKINEDLIGFADLIQGLKQKEAYLKIEGGNLLIF